MNTPPPPSNPLFHDNHRSLPDDKSHIICPEPAEAELQELLDKITPENCHPEISVGCAVGQEIE